VTFILTRAESPRGARLRNSKLIDRPKKQITQVEMLLFRTNSYMHYKSSGCDNIL